MDIELLAHRGQWNDDHPANSVAALRNALDNHFGIETDVRDSRGTLVISHDMPPGSGSPRLRDVLEHYADQRPAQMLALDIKADGLAEAVRDLMDEFTIERYFVFDMSIPDMVRYVRLGLPVFTRQSEYEPEPAFYAESADVWLDAFTTDWFDVGTIQRHLDRGKSVAVVSPELHGRAYDAVWKIARAARPTGRTRLFLCTDHPQRFGKSHAN